MGNSNLRQQREFPDGAGALHLPRSSGGRWDSKHTILKLLQVRYHFNLFFYPKRWEIRVCDSKENFPMVQVHCTCRSPAA